MFKYFRLTGEVRLAGNW